MPTCQGLIIIRTALPVGDQHAHCGHQEITKEKGKRKKGCLFLCGQHDHAGNCLFLNSALLIYHDLDCFLPAPQWKLSVWLWLGVKLVWFSCCLGFFRVCLHGSIHPFMFYLFSLHGVTGVHSCFCLLSSSVRSSINVRQSI